MGLGDLAGPGCRPLGWSPRVGTRVTSEMAAEEMAKLHSKAPSMEVPRQTLRVSSGPTLSTCVRSPRPVGT